MTSLPFNEIITNRPTIQPTNMRVHRAIPIIPEEMLNTQNEMEMEVAQINVIVILLFMTLDVPDVRI